MDTHILLWFLDEEHKLSEKARNIIFNPDLQKSVSIISLWEISIKNRIGKLSLEGDMTNIFDKVKSNGFGVIGIEQEHIEIYNTLPLIHRDPFDGLIITTAILEQMTIITADEDIQKYDVPWIW